MHKAKIIIEFWPWNVEKIKTVARSFGYSTVEPIYPQYLLQKPRLDNKWNNFQATSRRVLLYVCLIVEKDHLILC
jgi:hypothetical protein